jgi:hypothetical protein
MGTRKNKINRNKKGNENKKETKKKTKTRSILKFQKTKLYKLYMAELEKLKGGDLADVEKFMGGDWLDNLGIRKIGSLMQESLEVPYQVIGIAGIYLKTGIEAVWISKIYHWIKDNVWENSFIRGFFDIFMKVGGKIGEAIYCIYILLTKVITDIMEKKFRSVWLWVLTVITTLGVFDWTGSSGVLGSGIGSFFSGSVNGPIVSFFNTFNFWNFLGTIIGGCISILGNIWIGITTFISSTLFFSSFFQVVVVIAVLWGLNTLRLDYNKSNPELIELSKPKKLRATVKNQSRNQDMSPSVITEKQGETEPIKELAPSASDSSTRPNSPTKRGSKKKRTPLKSIPEEYNLVQAKEDKAKEAATYVGLFNRPYNPVDKKEDKPDDTASRTGVFQNLRANFLREGKAPKPTNPYGLKGGEFNNLSTRQLLAQLNKTSKSTLNEYKEKNGMGFQLALLCGFIKETENGILFTPQAAKTMKSFIISSRDSIRKNCKGEHCDQMTGGSKKNIDRLDLHDLNSIIDDLKAFEFVQTATIHALVRKNNSSEQSNIKDVLSHLKKEDIEWLQERDPEQIKIAIKLGILTPGFELTDIATGIATDGDVINGVSIKEQYAKFQSTVSQ